MAILNQEVTLTNDVVVNYHDILSVTADLVTFEAVAHIGSWETEEQCVMRDIPKAVWELHVIFADWNDTNDSFRQDVFEDNMSLALTYTPSKYYMVGSTLTTRVALPGSWNTTSITANGTSTATRSSVPNPTKVTVTVPLGKGLTDPAPVTVTTGTFSINTPVAGAYVITMKSLPYLEHTATITAS